MTLDTLTQIWISAMGLPALVLAMSQPMALRRLAVVLGLIGQPAWYAQLVIHEQWGMLPVFAGYTLAWLWGLWNLWIRPGRQRRVELKHGRG